MFSNPFKKTPSQVDPLIATILQKLTTTEPDSDEYVKMAAQLKELNEIKAQERKGRVSPDTWAIIGANLAGILLIVVYEQKHALTSKALSERLRAKNS